MDLAIVRAAELAAARAFGGGELGVVEQAPQALDLTLLFGFQGHGTGNRTLLG
jgi:hypothetical protein